MDTYRNSRSTANPKNGKARVMLKPCTEIAIALVGFAIATSGLAAVVFAGETGSAPETAPSKISTTRVEKSSAPKEANSIDGHERRIRKKRRWWNKVREELFAGTDLSADQARGLDAIIDEQLAKRAQLQQRDAEYQAARKLRDPERIEAAGSAAAAIRAQIKEPHEVYEAMRALLSEEQRPTFDMNRARRIAKGQTRPKKRATQSEQPEPEGRQPR
jgi:LTXXQ motif family protein